MENNEEAQPTMGDKIKLTLNKIKVKLIEFKDKMVAALQKFWAELKKMSWIEISVALVLLIVGTTLSIREFYDKEDPNPTYIMFFLIILGVVVGTFVWIKFTRRFYEKIIYYIAIHKWTRKLVAGGSYCYFEYKDPAKHTSKKKLLEPISITITSLIAFLGISATLFSIIQKVFEDSVENPYWWGVMAIITPILATALIPIAWSLDDSQMKTWSSGNKTNWTVSSRYKKRFNGFISIAVVITSFREGIDGEKIGDQASILLGILKTGILIMSISIGFFILIYYTWFRNYLREFSAKAANLATNETTLVEKVPAREESGNDKIAEDTSQEISKSQEMEEEDISTIVTISKELTEDNLNTDNGSNTLSMDEDTISDE